MKNIVIAGLMLFLLLIVTACSQGDEGETEASQEEEYELTFHTHYVGNEGRAETIQAIVDEFNEEHEGRARVVIDGTPDPQTLYDRNRTSLATDTVPDIFYFQHNPVDADRYYGSDKLIDLTPHLDDGWGDSFSEEGLEHGRYEDKIMAVPFESMMVPIYYNTELFAEAGIDEFPKTWDDFFEASEKLMDNGIIPIATGTGENAWSTQLMYSYIVSSIAGADFWELDLDDEAFLEGARVLEKLFEYSPSDAVGLPYSSYASYFVNENAAMIVNGPWMISQFYEQGGDEFADKVGAGTMPAYDGGEGEQGAVIAGVNFVLTGKQHTDPAKEEYAVAFMKYLTDPDNAKRLFLDSGALMEAASFEINEDDDADRISMDILSHLQEAPYEFKHLINAKSTEVANEFPSAVSALALGEVTPEEFVEQLANVDE
ncbi:ABC transporter substrate-binding protein [Salipaludibacillus aurantiacus]|uniref:Raffinose/stachyose/melibiose transport system substrate-binding protein n=1 Tax=Salipaludibacillus aurantiacus TaxID=1601833 RepID=A0A1H9UQW8_9BACI|nr:extracellular solute-binding protein [Salipaludibacillus aurantiacus]SES11748.1 raffinose/stachyose/melibiose transport system substrate-binding protein [Salipaludibacillus aurantiacus]